MVRPVSPFQFTILHCVPKKLVHQTRAGKNLGFLKKVFRFLGFIGFLYKDRTRQYDPEAHEKEKHPIHGRPNALPLLTDYNIQNYKHQALL